MPADTLREKLKALVEEWRYRYPRCSTRLAALLAESEPEPCSEWRHCEHDGEDGHRCS